jgi:hypothetical protein
MAGFFRRLIQAGGARLAVKAAKAMPVVGTVVAVGLVGYEVKKKGLVKGIANVALDATPVLGVTKNVIEAFTGDWISDKSERRRNYLRGKKE